MTEAVVTRSMSPRVGTTRRRREKVLPEQTEKRFGIALRDLVLALDDQRFLTPNGNVNWMEFVHETMEPLGVKYETLRKAIAGERTPSVSLMEMCAKALGIKPEFFGEYRLAQALHAFDPTEVGYEEAMKNLRVWAAAQKGKRH